MMQKLFVVVVVTVLVVVVQEVSAAPGHRGSIDVCGLIESTLQEIINNIKDPVPKDPIEIKLKQDHVADVYIRMDTCEIWGLKDFAVHDCAFQPTELGAGNISISIKSPKVTLNTPHYFINGSMVEHIELFGEGPGMISVDEMDIKVEGSGKFQISPISIVFDSAVLDLEMWRWTVNLEDLMPGTDLGTVFNEFFSMYGPAIFDMVENNINKNGKLVDFLNNLFS